MKGRDPQDNDEDIVASRSLRILRMHVWHACPGPSPMLFMIMLSCVNSILIVCCFLYSMGHSHSVLLMFPSRQGPFLDFFYDTRYCKNRATS
jgi:hypothetical protein